MKKTALCIGINDYKRNPLRGGVNDAIDWSCALENRGFHVTTLINANACKSRIISETRKIITDAKKGDIVVLTYAGHGTYFPLNINYESAMCLSDHMHGEVMRYTEIASIVGSRDSGVKFLFISDCCHSAS
ncbi:MAG: caspase family protein, partial [Zoogloea sp.]|nr:caspase family protein [Zoogloea sp.]